LRCIVDVGFEKETILLKYLRAKMLVVQNILREKVAVIADDITGANEIAATMNNRGKKSLVVNTILSDGQVAKLWEEYQGLVFNLNSRDLFKDKACQRIKNVLTLSPQIKKRLIYKKIDSTLRGNVAAEIGALLDAGCADIAVLVPAFPLMKRITVGGYHLVKQVPIGRSFYAQGFYHSYIPEILGNSTKYQIGHVNLGIIEKGADAIIHKLVEEHQKGLSIIFCDCCTDDDLKNIKKAISNIHLKVLSVGSAGLFREFFHEYTNSLLPSLIVCGSLNRMTRLQLARMLDQKTCGYLELSVSSHLLSDKGEAQIEKLRQMGESLLSQGKDLVVATSNKPWIHPNKLEVAKIKLKINQSLTYLVQSFTKNFSLAGLIISGGDTAITLLESLEALALEIIDEVAPLVPVGIIKGGRREGMVIITKTGGFGEENVFLKALDYLRIRSRKIER